MRTLLILALLVVPAQAADVVEIPVNAMKMFTFEKQFTNIAPTDPERVKDRKRMGRWFHNLGLGISGGIALPGSDRLYKMAFVIQSVNTLEPTDRPSVISVHTEPGVRFLVSPAMLVRFHDEKGRYRPVYRQLRVLTEAEIEGNERLRNTQSCEIEDIREDEHLLLIGLLALEDIHGNIYKASEKHAVSVTQTFGDSE